MSTCRIRAVTVCICATVTLFHHSSASVFALDNDRDGVDDVSDVCFNTPPGVRVDRTGRPLGDLDGDCDVDLFDFQIFQGNWTGSGPFCREGEPCDDGIPCTINDRCVRGTCHGTPNSALCNDGLFCNGVEVCSATSGCGAGAAVDCAALDSQCTRGACVEAIGACRAVPINPGQPCDDGLYCTQGEICVQGSCAGGSPRDCASLNGPCRAGYCDEASNACVAMAVSEDAACDDGLLCTEGETCHGGNCSGGTLVDCNNLSDECNVGVCDPATGDCTRTAANNGAFCDDRSDCTFGDRCFAGFCTGVVLPDGTECDDQDPGTTHSKCVSGGCTATIFYTLNPQVSYNCSAGGILISISALEFADDGATLVVFGAPAPMVGPGGIRPDGSFSVTGETGGSCVQRFILTGTFSGDNWSGNMSMQFTGCGPCAWPEWPIAGLRQP